MGTRTRYFNNAGEGDLSSSVSSARGDSLAAVDVPPARPVQNAFSSSSSSSWAGRASVVRLFFLGVGSDAKEAERFKGRG